MPCASVVPFQKTLLSSVTISTVGPRHGLAVVEPGDEDERVLRAVLDRDAEVRDLHDGRADRGSVARPSSPAGIGLPSCDRRPHEARARRAAARWRGRGRTTGSHRASRRAALGWPGPGGDFTKFACGFCRSTIVGIRSAGASGDDPLPDVLEVARVERQPGPPLVSQTPWPSPKLVNARSCQFSTMPIQA